MLSHLAQVQRQRGGIVRDFSEESCSYHEFVVFQDTLTFYALLHSNVLVLCHQHFFLHCYHFIHQPFVIRPRLIITVIPLDVHNTEPVLAILDINREIRIEVDALNYATGEVLLTKCKDGKWRLVVFISKSLNATERNYEIHNKEMLAVIRCLEVWRHYLEGVMLQP